MNTATLLERELQGSVEFYLAATNLDPQSDGYGLTLDSTKDERFASIAATGFALSAWVIGCERGWIERQRAMAITAGTLRTLLERVPHHRGFFAHFLDVYTAERFGKCEYSTIDSALCLNGVITASAYFDDPLIRELAAQLLERVDWEFITFEQGGRTLFRMAYNPDRDGDYVQDQPGFISQWDMAAEQKMMYLQAANYVDPQRARHLYQGFSRDRREYDGYEVIVNPGGNLFAYLFSEAWLDTARYVDADGVDWFENTRRAALANRSFCVAHSSQFRTYHANSWGLSAGDSPQGYEVAGGAPALLVPYHTGTVSIYSAIACLPFVPDETLRMMEYLYREHPQTWGEYGFFDAYNLAVDPPWYSHALYGIDKGCSMIMIENYLSGLIWNTYCNSPTIKRALDILGFRKRN